MPTIDPTYCKRKILDVHGAYGAQWLAQPKFAAMRRFPPEVAKGRELFALVAECAERSEQ